MAQSSRHLRDDRRGQALVQYAMLIALVGACLVFLLGVIGNAAHHAYESSAESLAGAQPGPPPQVGGGVILTGSSGGGHAGPPPSVPPPDSTVSTEPDDSTGVTRTASR